MSRVTNLIIVFSTLEDDLKINSQLRQFKYSSEGFYIVSVEDVELPKKWYGGNRYLECNIYIGAYNYLELDDFIEYLRTKVDWYVPEHVQLIVKEQSEFKFRIIDLF